MGAASALVDICAHLKKFFTDFRPETQSVTINFAMRTCEISFKVDIPDGWRKRQRKMVVPAHEGFSITKMFDSAFNQYRHEWRRAGTDYILDANKLPSPATYLVTMEGRISKDALDQLVYIKPSANPIADENVDSYWLESGLRGQGTLEAVYTDLDIDDVGFGVDVCIGRVLGLAIPPEIRAHAMSTGKAVRAALRRGGRGQLDSMRDYRTQSHALPDYDAESFAGLVNRLTSREVIERYVTVDRPYRLGAMQLADHYHGVVPQSITVGAATDLTLRSPAAKGLLRFRRQDYVERLRTEFKTVK